MKLKAIFFAWIAFVLCTGYQSFAQVVQLKSVFSYYSEIDSKDKLNWIETDHDSVRIEVNMDDDFVKILSKETKVFEIIDYRIKKRKFRRSIEIAMLCTDDRGRTCIVKLKSSKRTIYKMLYIYYKDVAYAYECVLKEFTWNDKTR